MIYKTLEKNPEIETFCTATDGNDGRAEPGQQKHLEKKQLFLFRNTTPERIEAIEQEGAQVIKVNGNYDEA